MGLEFVDLTGTESNQLIEYFEQLYSLKALLDKGCKEWPSSLNFGGYTANFQQSHFIVVIHPTSSYYRINFVFIPGRFIWLLRKTNILNLLTILARP